MPWRCAFATPEVNRFLEDEDYLYAIRLLGNDVLHQEIEDLTKPPPGWPSGGRQIR